MEKLVVRVNVYHFSLSHMPYGFFACAFYEFKQKKKCQAMASRAALCGKVPIIHLLLMLVRSVSQREEECNMLQNVGCDSRPSCNISNKIENRISQFSTCNTLLLADWYVKLECTEYRWIYQWKFGDRKVKYVFLFVLIQSQLSARPVQLDAWHCCLLI